MNLHTLKSKLKNLKRNEIHAVLIFFIWIGIFVAAAIYEYRHPSQRKELPKHFHRQWSGKFY